MTAAPIRLLLLEDNPGDARLVQAALAEYATGEFSITWVERLAEALARIKIERFDAALCDLGLPDSTGIATTKAIVAGAPTLPLVVLTGSQNDDLGRAAIALGAQDYLVKGESGGALIARTLRYAIERKRLEIGLRAANEALERRVAERTAALESANSTLRVSEARYRALFDNMLEGFAYCRMQYDDRDVPVDFVYLAVNAAFERLTGLKGVVGQPVSVAIPGIHLMSPELFEIYGRVASNGIPATFEYFFQPLGKWLAIAAYSPEQGHFVAVFDDITERKRALEALRESEQKYRGIYENLQDVYIETDLEGTILEVSPQIEILSHGQYARDDLLWNSTDIFYSDPGRRDAFFLALRESGTVKDFEADFTNRDGSRVVCSISAKIQVDADGTSKRVCATIRDITERKVAEEQLRAAEERFRGLVEQAIAGIYIIQDKKFVYVNPRFAEVFGYGSAEELIGRDRLSVVAAQDRESVAERMHPRIEGEVASVSYQFTGLCKDGSMVEIGVHSARATQGGRPAVIGLLQDISGKKRAEEKIQRYVAQLEKAFMSTVEVATTLSEMRDPYTAGHERRVAQISVAIGAELGLDARQQEGLRVAGYLHDIGKITIPSEILSKSGKLSAAEFTLIKGHPQASYDVLKGVTFPWPVADVVLQHHERIDGSGYPHGLKGKAILLEARILSVADVVEAMASHRPYRPGLGIDKALAEIERGRGTAYDTDVANACLKLFRENGYAIPP